MSPGESIHARAAGSGTLHLQSIKTYMSVLHSSGKVDIVILGAEGVLESGGIVNKVSQSSQPHLPFLSSLPP